MKVRTRAVRNRLVGDARKGLGRAAGSNTLVSKSEARLLEKDVARAAEAVRTKKGRVTVKDAVDEYAGRVTRALSAVDTRDKGFLSEPETDRLRDATLRHKVKSARAALAGDGTSGAPGAARVVASLRGGMSGLEVFHESGDHGVNASAWGVPGTTLDAVVKNVARDPVWAWTHNESRLELLSKSGSAAVADFNAFARTAFENERDDASDVVAGFTDAVEQQFEGLTSVRVAAGRDLGSRILLGKASDGFVAVAVYPYSD